MKEEQWPTRSSPILPIPRARAVREDEAEVVAGLARVLVLAAARGVLQTVVADLDEVLRGIGGGHVLAEEHLAPLDALPALGVGGRVVGGIVVSGVGDGLGGGAETLGNAKCIRCLPDK